MTDDAHHNWIDRVPSRMRGLVFGGGGFIAALLLFGCFAIWAASH